MVSLIYIRTPLKQTNQEKRINSQPGEGKTLVPAAVLKHHNILHLCTILFPITSVD